MADPVTLAVAKQHLRIDSATAAEDTELTAIISAATQYAEAITKRDLRGSTVTKVLSQFPYSSNRTALGIPLYKGPVASVTELKYFDTDDVEQTVAGSNYRIVTNYGMSTLYPAMSGTWPTDCNNEPGNITLTYVIDGTIPEAIQQAILLIVGSLYENREDGVLEQGIVAVRAPIGAKDLLHAYRMR